MREKARTAAPGGGLSCGSSPSRTIRCVWPATPKTNQVYAVTYRGCTRRRTGGVRDGVHKPPNEPKKEPPKYINPRSKTPVAPQNRKPSSLALAENLGHVAENVGTDNVGTEELGHIKKTNSSKKIKELRRLKHPLNPRPENLNS